MPEQAGSETKSKKARKNKKKESGDNVAAVEADVKKAKVNTKQDTKDEDVSVKTDSGIADEPASESSAAKKKSKSKKQREKKAAAVAAAAAQQQQEVPQSPQVKEKIVIDLTPSAAAVAAVASPAAKPKDKKKKPKNSSTEPKPKESNEKVQYETWIGFFFSLVFGFIHSLFIWTVRSAHFFSISFDFIIIWFYEKKTSAWIW